MNERKNVKREVTALYLDGETLDEAISTLRGLAETYGGGSVIKSCQESYSDYQYLALFVSEPETDQEFQERIVREETARKQREEREAAEFRRLSAKFAKAEGRKE